MDDAEETFNISYCYEHGIGVEEDKHKAFICYKKIANRGVAGGKFNVI